VEISPPRVARLYLARKDREAVREAQRIYDALVKHIERHGIVTNMKGQHNVEGRKFLPPGEDHGLWVFFDPRRRGTYYTNSGKLVIGRPNIGRVEGYTTRDIALDMAKKARKKIIHELTHHLDRVRMGEGWTEAEKGYKTPDQDPAAYYNDPIEMKAFFQDAIDPFVQEFDEAMAAVKPDDPEDQDHQMAVMFHLPEIARRSFKDFFWQVQLKWPSGSRFRDGGLWENLTPKNKRRMQKRVYDLWAKFRKEARDTVLDLKKRGDEAAQMSGL